MKKIILLSILITASAFAITMLDQPVQFNAIDLHSMTINAQNKYATVTFVPIAVDANGNILGVGSAQPPVKIPRDVLLPASCMTVEELGLTKTNNFAEVLFRTILYATGMQNSQSTFKWATRVPVSETNTVDTWVWDGSQSNLVSDVVITNYYIYK